MRFLCLHGLGTNSDIFVTQTGPLREELADNHEFDFLDGDFETCPADGVGELFPGPYWSWCDFEGKRVFYTAANVQQAISNIKEYISENGPYDGAMGFSQGVAMVMALLLDHQAKHPFEAPLFSVAIFFNGGMPEPLKQVSYDCPKMPIPTAHILGGKKDWLYDESKELVNACKKDFRVEFEHDEGHSIPCKPEITAGMACAIRRSIDLAKFKLEFGDNF